jgi:hypothetical protein
MPEIWKPVLHYEKEYEVSNKGRVRRIGVRKGARVGRILAKAYTEKGYLMTTLWKNNVSRSYTIHILVARAFVEGDHSLTVDHIDGNKLNNDPSNLEWITREENTRRQHALGLCNTTTQFKHTKITPDQYECIIQRFDEGEPCWFIALDFDCCRTLINWIVREPKLA